MKYLLFISLACLVLACDSNNQTEKSQQTSASLSAQTKLPEDKTYMVITSWTTKDRAKAMEHVPIQQKQLMSLWNKGLVENIYYNQKAKFNDGQPLPLIAFFSNGQNEFDVRAMLDSTDIVANGLASYTLREVGRNIFPRSENAAKLSAGTQIESYAVVWTLAAGKAKTDTASYKDQAMMTAKLQDVGILENIYVDLNPIDTKPSAINPAVFIINAKNEVGARRVLDQMPIVKSGKATYGLHDVGQFFLGIKDN